MSLASYRRRLRVKQARWARPWRERRRAARRRLRWLLLAAVVLAAALLVPIALGAA